MRRLNSSTHESVTVHVPHCTFARGRAGSGHSAARATGAATPKRAPCRQERVCRGGSLRIRQARTTGPALYRRGSGASDCVPNGIHHALPVAGTNNPPRRRHLFFCAVQAVARPCAGAPRRTRCRGQCWEMPRIGGGAGCRTTARRWAAVGEGRVRAAGVDGVPPDDSSPNRRVSDRSIKRARVLTPPSPLIFVSDTAHVS